MLNCNQILSFIFAGLFKIQLVSRQIVKKKSVLQSQVEQDAQISETSPHIANIGRMVEDMENKIRNTLNEIYFGKTKDIVNGLRSVQSLADQRQQAALRQDLAAALQRRNANN